MEENKYNVVAPHSLQAQRYKFQGPDCGPKPAPRKAKRLFTRSQLRAGQTMIGLQSGTNKFASQKGMSFGAVRHISDIRCDDINPDSNSILTQQTATNKYASQAGSRGFGAVRHISDIKSEEMSEDGKSIIALQSGTNQFASQKGMSFGSVRHVADIKADDVSIEGMATLGLQSGTNKFASQSGMTSFGAQRHISDIKITELCDEMECLNDEEEEYPKYE